MDIIKKSQDIITNKIQLKSNEENTIKHYIVYLLHNDDIVYIGKTSNILEYVEERKDKYSVTHYSYEEVNKNDVDNYLAELVLEIQPISNNRVPNNTKYISHNAAKKDYHIYKSDFRKVYNEYGGFIFRNSLYIEKKIFDDIFALLPYHKNMPKVGNRILLKNDFSKAPLNIWYGHTLDILYDKDGNPVNAVRDQVIDWEEQYKNLKFLENNEYEVINLIDSESFEAIKINNSTKLILKAMNKSNNWSSDFETDYKNIWIDSVDHNTSITIKESYLELISNE